MSPNSDKPKSRAIPPPIMKSTLLNVFACPTAFSKPKILPRTPMNIPYNERVMANPKPNNRAMARPFLYPLPMLSGTIIKTRGRVQGRTIIEIPTTKAKVKSMLFLDIPNK